MQVLAQSEPRYYYKSIFRSSNLSSLQKESKPVKRQQQPKEK